MLLKNQDASIDELTQVHNETPREANGWLTPYELVFGVRLQEKAKVSVIPVHPTFPVGTLVLHKKFEWATEMRRNKGEFPYHGPYVVYRSSPTEMLLRDVDGTVFRVSPHMYLLTL